VRISSAERAVGDNFCLPRLLLVLLRPTPNILTIFFVSLVAAINLLVALVLQVRGSLSLFYGGIGGIGGSVNGSDGAEVKGSDARCSWSKARFSSSLSLVPTASCTILTAMC
jgi:hypothetical protein